MRTRKFDQNGIMTPMSSRLRTIGRRVAMKYEKGYATTRQMNVVSSASHSDRNTMVRTRGSPRARYASRFQPDRSVPPKLLRVAKL